MTKTPLFTVRFPLYLTPEQAVKLQALASHKQISCAAVIRAMLDRRKDVK